MRKEGLGAVGLLQEVLSGRQEYRETERGAADSSAASSSGVKIKKQRLPAAFCCAI